jgi:hypothetical protein
MKITNPLGVAILLIFTLHLLGQDQSRAGNEKSLYAQALFASVTEMQKQYGYQTDAPDYHHMFVSADPSITTGLPAESGDYHVEYLDREGQIQRYRKLRKDFPVLEIHPAHNEGAQLKITVSLSYFSYKRRRSMFAVSDWSDVEFRFDCEKQEFVISSVKLGGI